MTVRQGPIESRVRRHRSYEEEEEDIAWKIRSGREIEWVWAGVSLHARTHARVYVAHAYNRGSNRIESRSQERRKDEASQSATSQPLTSARSGRPTVDSLESWPRTRTADYVTVRRTTKALLRAPPGRHSYSIFEQDGERSREIFPRVSEKIRGLAIFLLAFCRVRFISGL